jgi:hypothetical protein
MPYNTKNNQGEDVEDVEIKIEEVDDEGGQFLCFKSNSKICGLKVMCTYVPFLYCIDLIFRMCMNRSRHYLVFSKSVQRFRL